MPEIFLGTAVWGWALGLGAVFFRIMGFLLGFPLWSNQAVARPVKIAVVALFTAMVVMGLGWPRVEVEDADVTVWLVVLGPEFLLGLALGMLLRVILAAAEGVAQIMSLSIGLGFANFVDPGTGMDSTAVGRLVVLMVTILLVANDFHLPILGGMFESFILLPVGMPIRLRSMGWEIAGLGTLFFELSLRLAAPVIATALMIYLILAVINRVAPQMNLFVIGFAVIIPAGLVVLFWEAPELMMVFIDEFERLPAMMRRVVLLGRQ